MFPRWRTGMLRTASAPRTWAQCGYPCHQLCCLLMGEIMAAAKPIPGIDIGIVAIRRGHSGFFERRAAFRGAKYRQWHLTDVCVLAPLPRFDRAATVSNTPTET